MKAIIEDFEAIAAAMKADRPNKPSVCATCDGNGWQCSWGPGGSGPYFRICEGCGNPDDIPRPEV